MKEGLSNKKDALQKLDAMESTLKRAFGVVKGAKLYDRMRDYVNKDFGREYDITPAERRRIARRLRFARRDDPLLSSLIKGYRTKIGVSRLRVQSSKKSVNDSQENAWLDSIEAITDSGKSLRDVERLIPDELNIEGGMFCVFLPGRKIRVIEYSWCGSSDDPKKRLPNEVDGIIYSEPEHKPIAYRFATSVDEYGNYDYANGVIIDAQFVQHIVDPDRVVNGRGVPRLSSVVHLLMDVQNLIEAKNFKILINAFIAIVRKEKPKLYDLDNEDVDAEEETNANAGRTTTDTESFAKQIKDVFRPGDIPVAGIDGDGGFEVLESQHYVTDFKEFIMFLMQLIAGSLQFPLEVWFKGFGGMSWASAKAIWQNWDDTRTEEHALIREKFLVPLFRWWREQTVNLKLCEATPKGDERKFTFFYSHTPSLDPIKDVQAAVARLDAGLTAPQDEMAKLNDDYWEEIVDKRVEYFAYVEAKAKARGVNPDRVIATKTNQGLTPAVQEAPVTDSQAQN